jgi:hypothetical protein
MIDAVEADRGDHRQPGRAAMGGRHTGRLAATYQARYRVAPSATLWGRSQR